MNERNLVVCDREFRYANGLGENISERSELAFRVHTCTGAESVMRILKERKIHILIIDEDFAYEERSKMEAEQVFVLTRGTCRDLGDEEKEIYKFQSADKILAEVFASYYEKTNQRFLRHVETSNRRILAVYSPIHRIGKTTFAVSLGKELAKRGKTLYLNLEEYPDAGGRFLRAEGKNLGDLLYYLRQTQEDMAMRLSAMPAKLEELYYIPPMLMSTDLKEVPFEDWQLLFQTLRRESVYENIVLDMGESIQGLIELLGLCDRIYMPVLEDEISRRRLALFEENVQALCLPEVLRKTCRFVAAEDMETCAKKMIREEERE